MLVSYMFFLPPRIHFFTPLPPSFSNNSHSLFKSQVSYYFLQRATFKISSLGYMFFLHDPMVYSISPIISLYHIALKLFCILTRYSKLQKNMNFVLSTINPWYLLDFNKYSLEEYFNRKKVL